MSALFPCVHLGLCCGWAACVQNCKLLKVHGVRLAVTAVCDASVCCELSSGPLSSSPHRSSDLESCAGEV